MKREISFFVNWVLRIVAILKYQITISNRFGIGYNLFYRHSKSTYSVRSILLFYNINERKGDRIASSVDVVLQVEKDILIILSKSNRIENAWEEKIRDFPLSCI